jgi:hypothetical protein
MPVSLPTRFKPIFMCVVLLIGVLFSLAAYPADKPPTKKTTLTQKKKSLVARTKAPIPPTFSQTLNLNPVSVAVAVPAKPSVALADVPTRILNLRIHPFYLMQMLADHETIAAGRVDLDFLVADRFSFGPSFHYNNNLTLDSNANSVEQTTYELGMLFNEYLTDSSSAGGLIVREHAYWINADATRTDGTGNVTGSSQTTSGLRAGLELVYQKILKCGLNFEIGGGVTYQVLPYSIQFANGATVGPTSNFSPTVSLGVGWAF